MLQASCCPPQIAEGFRFVVMEVEYTGVMKKLEALDKRFKIRA